MSDELTPPADAIKAWPADFLDIRNALLLMSRPEWPGSWGLFAGNEETNDFYVDDVNGPTIASGSSAAEAICRAWLIMREGSLYVPSNKNQGWSKEE